MGTFKVNYTKFSVIPNFVDLFANGSLYQLAPGMGAGTVVLSADGACISLDGLAPVTFTNLPAGFTILTAAWPVNMGTIGSALPGVDSSVTASWEGYILTVIDTLHAGNFSWSIANASGIGAETNVLKICTGLISIVGSTGNSAVIAQPGVNGSPFIGFNGFLISGTYEIQAFSFALSNPVPPGPVKMGTQVTITGTKVDKIDHINITYTDGSGNPKTVVVPKSAFIFQSFYLLIFFIPFSFGIFQGTINLTAGIQFFGSVPLGAYTILYESGSGIYKIVKGQSHDTLYNRADPNSFTSTILVLPSEILGDE